MLGIDATTTASGASDAAQALEETPWIDQMLEHVGQDHAVDAGDAGGREVEVLGRAGDDAVEPCARALGSGGDDLDADRLDAGPTRLR